MKMKIILQLILFCLLIHINLADCPQIIINTFKYINPVQGKFDSPDPGVIKNNDGYYYAFTTGGYPGKFPIWKSKNLS